MNIHVKRSEFLFYASYIILYISLFLGDIGGLDSSSSARYLRLLSYSIIAVQFFRVRYKSKDLWKFIVLFAITCIYAILSKDLYWCILILLIIESRKVNSNGIFKVSFSILLIGMLIVLLLCLVGVLPDIITYRDILSATNDPRHSIGFYHSNVLPLIVMYLEIYYIFIGYKKLRRTVIYSFIAVQILLKILCNSRNAFYISMMLSIIMIILKYKKRPCDDNKVLYLISALSIPVMSGFSLAMMYLLTKGGIWDKIDTLFSGRFRLAIYKAHRIGIHLINFMSNEAYFRDSVVYANGVKLDTIVLDNGYLYIMLRYGILAIIFYVIIGVLLSKKVKSNTILLISIIAVFIANFGDNDLVDYSFLPFILLAFNTKFQNQLVASKYSVARKSGRL